MDNTTKPKSASLTSGQLEQLRTAQDLGMLRDFGGVSFCFTGALSVRRADLEQLIKDLGGMVKKTVTSDLDVLVDGDHGRTAALTQKASSALDLGVYLLDESELVELLLPSPKELREDRRITGRQALQLWAER